jgi:DNA adenine methylase
MIERIGSWIGERLAELVHRLKGYVVLSGYPCALYDKLYKGWSRLKTTARRDITQKRRSERMTECLWLSPRTAKASPAVQGSLFR